MLGYSPAGDSQGFRQNQQYGMRHNGDRKAMLPSHLQPDPAAYTTERTPTSPTKNIPTAAGFGNNINTQKQQHSLYSMHMDRRQNTSEFLMPRSSSIPATLSETVQSRFLFSKNPAHGPLAAFNKRSPPKKYGAEIPLLRTSRVDNQKKEGLWRGGRKVYVEDVENDHLHLQSNSGARMPKGVLDRIFNKKLPTQPLYPQPNLTQSPPRGGNRTSHTSTSDTDCFGGADSPVLDIPIPPLQASTEIWRNIAMESKKIEQPAKSKVEACPPTTDSTLQVNGHGIDTGSANYPVSTSDPTNGMAKSSPQHSITGAPPGGHFNPKATHFAPKRHIPKNWYSQCRWTHPPGDNGRGVDNCRWGRRCDFGHPGEEYYEFPGIKNEFRNTSSIAPIGTVFVRPADPTVYSMNPRSMYQHLVQQRYGYSTYPNTPGYGGPMYYPSYGMPQMQPMQYPPVVLPVGIAYMERPNRNWTEEASPAKKQNEETSPAKKQDEIIIPGYNGPVIVRSPEPARPLPPGERMPKRSSSRESSKSSGSNSRSGGEPKSSDKSESDSNPEAPASDGVVSASNGEE